MVFGFFACIADELDFCLCPGWVALRFFTATALLSPSLVTVSKRTFWTRVEGLVITNSLYLVLTVSKRTFRTRVKGGERLVFGLSSDLGGVWLFRMHCRGT